MSNIIFYSSCKIFKHSSLESWYFNFHIVTLKVSSSRTRVHTCMAWKRKWRSFVPRRFIYKFTKHEKSCLSKKNGSGFLLNSTIHRGVRMRILGKCSNERHEQPIEMRMFQSIEFCLCRSSVCRSVGQSLDQFVSDK